MNMETLRDLLTEALRAILVREPKKKIYERINALWEYLNEHRTD